MLDLENLDWPVIVLRLKGKRTYRELAEIMGCHPSVFSSLISGATAQPKFTTGVKILDLHYDLFPELHKTEYMTKGATPCLQQSSKN